MRRAGQLRPLTQSLLESWSGNARCLSTTSDLKEVLKEKIPEQQERLKAIKKNYGEKELGKTTVNMLIGGMRGINGLLWETSLLDPEEGIRFRGYSIPELQEKLPSAEGGSEPLPEGLLWLLLTGEIPTKEETFGLSENLRERSKLPTHVQNVLNALPKDTHPMTQLSTAVMALQKPGALNIAPLQEHTAETIVPYKTTFKTFPDSKFSAAYAKGINKKEYWDPVYEDSLDLIAKMPAIAAMIYRRTYKGDLIDADPKLDWAANLSHQMGFDDEGAKDLFRLYQTIHTDHEGGNVSAHTAHVVASALSDPYFSFSAGLNGLAGPLHGLANQEVLTWLNQVQQQLGNDPSEKDVAEFVKSTLSSGKVVPGYGHAVLRKTDPRYSCQREFAKKHLPDDPMFKLVSKLYTVVPDILLATGKVKNPWPNVDAHSGVLLQYFGIKEANFYTVLFGVSRSIGILSQGIWSRALGLPIERPKSMTMETLEKKFG